MGTAAIAVAQPQDQQHDQQQGHRHGMMDPQQRVNMLAKELKLTDDQKSKLLPILTDQQQQMQSLRQDTSMSREDRMAKMRSIHEQTNAKVNGILNDDQKQKYAEMQQKMREHMQQRQGGGGAPPSNQ
jgi:hypothetical protein